MQLSLAHRILAAVAALAMSALTLAAPSYASVPHNAPAVLLQQDI